MKTRNRDYQRLHVFNLTVLDNHQDADTGAKHTLKFVEMVKTKKILKIKMLK
jgi:hypothetical protein